MENNVTDYWVKYHKNIKYIENLAEFCNITIILRNRGALIETYVHI